MESDLDDGEVERIADLVCSPAFTPMYIELTKVAHNTDSEGRIQRKV